MFKLDFITSILHLPERSLRLIKDNTFILTLPVVLHKCPHCNNPTTRIHSYRNQPVKSVFLFNTNYWLFVKCCGLYRTEIFSVRFFMHKIL